MWLEAYDVRELQIRRTICNEKRKEQGAEGFRFLLPIPSRDAVTCVSVFCHMSLGPYTSCPLPLLAFP